MKLAVMQPYFLPYIGYFQLIDAVDEFVVYDNIKYTKKGWINRNRYCRNGTEALFSLPLAKGSDFLHVRDRELSAGFSRAGLLAQFREAYRHAPYFDDVIPTLRSIVECPQDNLFDYIFNSLQQMCALLGIGTELRISSAIAIDHDLRSQEKVLAFCRELGADTYVNAIGGTELYDRATFTSARVNLHFMKSRLVEYEQSATPFIPWLSIIDVLMCNGPDKVRREMLQEFDLV